MEFPGGPVEACDESWSSRSNATALAGYAITTTTTTKVSEENQGALWGLIGSRISWLKARRKMTSETRVCLGLADVKR